MGGRSRHQSGWRLSVVAVLAGALVSTAVPEAAPEGTQEQVPAWPRYDRVVGVPLLEGAHRNRGELADGFRVPAGTVLLGAPMPVDHRPSGSGYGDGWFATLLFVGEVDQVVGDLDDQARELGLTRDVDPGQEFPSCRLIHRGHVRSCHATWHRSSARLSMWLARGRVPAAHVPGQHDRLHTQRDLPVATVRLRVDHPLPGRRPTREPPPRPCEPAPTGIVPPVTEAGWEMPRGWVQPPGPGDLLGDDILPAGADVPVVHLRLPAGAWAVSPVAPGTGQAINYRATIAVSGASDAIWSDLADQIRAHVPDVEERTSRSGLHEIRTLTGSSPVGVCYALEAATTNGRSWIEVSTTYDWSLELERRS